MFNDFSVSLTSDQKSEYDALIDNDIKFIKEQSHYFILICSETLIQILQKLFRMIIV